MASLPSHARVVVIGGGIVGCSIAYHLAKMGEKDVLLVEKSGLTQGATWHAAGLVGQLRPSRNTTRMLQKSIELYDALEEETGQSTSWKKLGSLRVACSEERMLEVKRAATMAKSFGLEMHVISPKEAQDLFPVMAIDDVVGAAFIPGDGEVDPSSVTQALAKGARMHGARIMERVEVTGINLDRRRAVEVVTNQGTIKTEVVVNAAGMWGRPIGLMAGVQLPACALEHQYMVTEPIPGMPKDMTSLRDPDNIIYFKPEGGGLAVGGWEENTPPFGDNGIRSDFAQELLPDNFDRFEQVALLAAKRVPAINDVGIRKLINGPIPYSADGDFLMGKAPELDNYFVCTGLLYGIAAGGGAGQMMAEWVLDGAPSLDLWPLDVRRFNPHHNTKHFMYRRAVELYGKHYALHAPGVEHESVRCVRLGPLYRTLKDKGAVYGSKAGWERPNWFAPEGVEAVDASHFDRTKSNWFEHVGNEHRAVRERAGLIDQTSFAKFEVRGPKALAALQRLAVSDLDKPAGSVIYTQFCNERGGIECDLTILRLAEDRFYIVTGSGFGVHDLHWINSNIVDDGSVTVDEVTSSRAVINLCGPRARQVLEKVAEGDVSNQALAFSTFKEIFVGAAPVRAVRIGYVGELGWELHTPTEYGCHVYDLLWEAGQEFGIANVGYRAIDTLRMEKGYLYWSSDITPDYNPFEAGLGFRVNLDKGDFIGREALARIKKDGVSRKLCVFTIDEPVSLYGGEPIIKDGQVIDITTSANYGHTVAKTIAHGYLPLELAGETDFEIEAFGVTYRATRHDGALYDPEMAKLKA